MNLGKEDDLRGHRATGARRTPSSDPVGIVEGHTGLSGLVQDTVRGMLYVAAGQTVLFLWGLVGGVFLARLLTPRDFGVYAVTSFVALQLGAISELGLSAKLIHDANPPSLNQMRSVFALQCIIAGVAYVGLYVIAPWLGQMFQLDEDSATFWRTLGLLIVLTPLSTIPIATLSRSLRFDLLMFGELVTGGIFQSTAIILAFLNYGYWSFGAAALLASIGRITFLNIIASWGVGLAWDLTFLRRSVSFGGSFQLSSLTSVARDNIVTFLGGPLYGPTVVGLLNWSHRLAWSCSETYVAICAKLAFPSLSRMRSNPELFRGVLAKMLRYVNLATFLTLSVVAGLADEIVHFVFTDKWAPAIPLFYCFAIRMAGANYTTLLDAALKAQGRPERSLQILSMWTVWEWGLAVLSIAIFGYVGIALSAAVGIWLAVVWLYREVRRDVALDLVRIGGVPLLSGMMTFAALHWAKGVAITSLAGLCLAVMVGCALYLLLGSLFEGKWFWLELRDDIAVFLNRCRRVTPMRPRLAD